MSAPYCHTCKQPFPDSFKVGQLPSYDYFEGQFRIYECPDCSCKSWVAEGEKCSEK